MSLVSFVRCKCINCTMQCGQTITTHSLSLPKRPLVAHSIREASLSQGMWTL
jgi:hypothetical protein